MHDDRKFGSTETPGTTTTVSVSSTDRCWLRLLPSNTEFEIHYRFSILYGSLLAETDRYPQAPALFHQFQYPLRIVVG